MTPDSNSNENDNKVLNDVVNSNQVVPNATSRPIVSQQPVETDPMVTTTTTDSSSSPSETNEQNGLSQSSSVEAQQPHEASLSIPTHLDQVQNSQVTNPTNIPKEDSTPAKLHKKMIIYGLLLLLVLIIGLTILLIGK